MMTRKLATIVALKFLSTKKTINVIKFSFRMLHLKILKLEQLSNHGLKNVISIIYPFLLHFFFDYFRAVIKQAIYKILKIFLKKQTNYVSDMIK